MKIECFIQKYVFMSRSVYFLMFLYFQKMSKSFLMKIECFIQKYVFVSRSVSRKGSSKPADFFSLICLQYILFWHSFFYNTIYMFYAKNCLFSEIWTKSKKCQPSWNLNEICLTFLKNTRNSLLTS